MKRGVFICFFTYLQFGLCDSDEACTSINGDLGNCIDLISCQPYVKIFQESRNNPAVIQMLRQAHCGFNGNYPKVCCPLQGLQNTQVPNVLPKTNTNSGGIVTLPEPPVCGTSNVTIRRVVGGGNAKLGAYPWMALLGYRSGSDTRWLCGGSLISSRHVLTAAHCIHNLEKDLYLVRLGELDLARDDEGATPLDVLIKEKIKHEDYKTKVNDIGILVLDEEVQFTDLIRPICIPRHMDLRSMNFEGYHPFIAGWGDTKFRGPAASHLQALQLPVVSNALCANAYIQYMRAKIDERVLCAGFVNGAKDSCQGDSGGPLMQPVYNIVDLTSPMYQIGIVSYGKNCAEAGFPGVYSRVTHFVPWIEKKIFDSGI